MLYPNLGQALHKASGKRLSMFLAIYLPKGVTAAPKMSIELYAAGQLRQDNYQSSCRRRTPAVAFNIPAAFRSMLFHQAITN